MSAVWKRVRPLVPPLAVLGLHALALYALGAVDLIGRLLGAADTLPVGLLVVTAGFYLVRLLAIIVAPGWLLVALARVVFPPRSGS